MSTDIQTFIFDLSRELHIEGTQGVTGNELELIALVRNCPFLYNKSRNDFKDTCKRNSAWRAIATVMQGSVLDCQSRWKSLREQYGRIKRALNSNEPNSDRLLQWEYLDDMKFLDNHIIPRRKFKSVHLDNDEEDDDEDNYRIEWLEECKNIENPELKLINLVKQCPIIYDKNHFDNRDVNKKEQIWLSISKTLGRSVLDCKTRWKTLRERYARERKLHKEDATRKPWDYYDEMSFLNLHVKARSGYRPILPKPSFSQGLLNNADSNVVLTSNLSDNDISFHVQKLEFVDPTYQSCSLEGSDPVNMSPSSATSQSVSESSRQNVSVKSASQGTPQSAQNLQDEDDLFGLSIAAELRRINGRKKKMKLKAEIFKLLSEVESEESVS